MIKHRYSSFSFYLSLLIFLISSGCDEAVDPDLTGSVSGKVVNSINEPIANVLITTDPATEAVLTDSSGNFTIDRAPEGELVITAKKEGYRTGTSNVRVYEGETTTLTFLMSEGGEGALGKAPENPSPADAATEQPANIRLAWSPVGNGNAKYDVLLYDADDLTGRLVASGVSDTSVVVEDLEYNTNYFWQVRAFVDSNSKELGPVWSFRTLRLPENWIFFARNDDGNFNIYSHSLDSTANTNEPAEAYPLTQGGGHEVAPKLSPDLEQLAYASNEEVEWHLYVADNQGNDPSRVTTLPVAGYHHDGNEYCWSPDGGELLYSHYDKLYRVRKDGSGLNAVATAPSGKQWREVDWTQHNGGKIVAVATGSNIYDSELYFMNVDGSGMKRIVGNEPGFMGSPEFSVDGTKILFTLDYAGFTPDPATGRQLDSRIVLLDLASGARTDLSGNSKEDGDGTADNKPDGTNDLMPEFSPDGSGVIFVNAPNYELVKNGSIYTMNIDGSNRQLVVENGTTPSWE